MSSKKRKVVNDEAPVADEGHEETDDSEDGMDEDQQFVGENIQVDFEARAPNDQDFHGIKKLLHQLFLKANINVSEMADVIIGQSNIGSVVKQCEMDDPDSDDEAEDDDDVFGVSSVVSLTHKKDNECVQQFKSFLIDKCAISSPESQEKLLSALNKHVGFIVNERFINIPPQMSVPLFKSLQNEIDSHCKAKNFNFDFFLLICKVFKLKPEQKKGKKKKGGKTQEEELYSNPEEEIITKNAWLTYDYDVSSERDTALAGSWDEDDDELSPWRRVVVLPSNALDDIVVSIHNTYAQENV